MPDARSSPPPNGLPDRGAGTAAARQWTDRIEPTLALTTAALCVLLFLYKLVLVRRLNINWDEFYFLNHLYDQLQGELTLVMQGAYTHAFTWIALVPGNEIDQIHAGRMLMVGLLGLTAALVWRLSKIWLTGVAAAVPPLVFLSATPVMEHGGSFRADSLLAPLSIAALVLLFRPARSVRSECLAGLLIGVAFAITVKVVLFAPLFLAAIALASGPARTESLRPTRDIAMCLLRIACVSAAVGAALITLHWVTVAGDGGESVSEFAVRSASKTLLDVPWFPRPAYLIRYYGWQPVYWIAIGLGTLVALVKRRFDLAALALSLLPIAFYRNSFPYYYVVMLAPAVVLVGWLLSQAGTHARRHASAAVTSCLIAALWLALVFQGARDVHAFAADGQQLQRQVVAGVHEIFPEPVAYIDRCAMIPSFQKANFYMSTWGIESYQQRGVPFMPEAIDSSKPAFVLVNVPSLSSTYEGPRALLAEDRHLLTQHYVDYWGPVRVAGGHSIVDRGGPARVSVPFAGAYRVIASEPLVVDGSVVRDGDVLQIAERGVEVARLADAKGEAASVTLVIAQARPAPAVAPPPFPIFKEF